MKQFKKALCTMLLIPCLMPASQAEDLPSAQFSVDIWPYRQETNCDEIAPTAAPEILPTAPVVTQSPNVTIAPTAAPTLKPGGSNSTGDYTTDLVTTQEYLAWNLLNQDRIANGLLALPLDEELCRLARIKSTDMKSIIEGSEYVIKIKVERKEFEGRENYNQNIYRCIVTESLSGEIAKDEIIDITFFPDTVCDGEEYIVAVNISIDNRKKQGVCPLFCGCGEKTNSGRKTFVILL